jgi:hypothetical protein
MTDLLLSEKMRGRMVRFQAITDGLIKAGEEIRDAIDVVADASENVDADTGVGVGALAIDGSALVAAIKGYDRYSEALAELYKELSSDTALAAVLPAAIAATLKGTPKARHAARPLDLCADPLCPVCNGPAQQRGNG